MTVFFTQVPQHNISILGQNQSPSSEVDTNTVNTTLIISESNYDDARINEVSQSLPVNSLDTSTANADSSYFSIHSWVEINAENESLVDRGDGGEIILSAKDEVSHNVGNDPGLWLDFSADDVAYWFACGPSDCQHHTGPFDKSYMHFSGGKPVRYCSQKLLVGTKPSGEKYKREWLLYSPSTGSVYCFVCKLFAPKNFLNFFYKRRV